MNSFRNFATRIQPFQKTRVFFQRRTFGAASSQPQSQSQQARLWEGHNTQPEGWETTVYATYFASTVLITLALGFAPDTTINTWAGNEARVRMEMKSLGSAEGGIDQEEFGVHYNVPERVYDFDMKIVDNPFNEEDDDEDEEEDEDEDEEEDDDE